MAAASQFRSLTVYGRVLLAALAVVVVIGAVTRSPWRDTLELGVQMLIGVAIGMAASRLTPDAWFDGVGWRALVAIATAVAAPLTAVVLATNVLFHHEALSLIVALHIAPTVALSSVVMTGLAFLVRGHPTATHAAAAGAAPPKFLERLPERLKGADLYAVEAEDHYLRLHTSAGQDLILMRLSDAIAELEGLEGAQTHRSWWVAKNAVASAERFDGRAALTLKDGAEVPVSRGFARTLRQAGWF